MEINKLKEQIYDVLNQPLLSHSIVIRACDTLSKDIASGKYQSLIQTLGLDSIITKDKLNEVIQMLSEEFLMVKMKCELGGDMDRIFPLGVLFHIGAGNMAGLSAYSVIEGLLVGNINLVKLPSNETGISILLLEELIKIEPSLKNYIHLFEVASHQEEELKQLASLADALIVWGGDSAIKAIRSIAPVNTKLIEWGHKMSFAYITSDVKQEELEALAHHILETKQQLCSSCQGIYVDSSDEMFIESFCVKIYSYFRKRDSKK